jgi:hypothetical protein
VAKGKMQQLIIYQGDDPKEMVRLFGTKHGLLTSKQEKLLSVV